MISVLFRKLKLVSQCHLVQILYCSLDRNMVIGNVQHKKYSAGKLIHTFNA